MAHAVHDCGDIAGLLQYVGAEVVTGTVKNEVVCQACLLPRFDPLLVHEPAGNVLALLPRREDPTFLAVGAAHHQNFHHAVAHGNVSAPLPRFAIRIEDHAIVPIDVFNPHPVKFTSIPHACVAHKDVGSMTSAES